MRLAKLAAKFTACCIFNKCFSKYRVSFPSQRQVRSRLCCCEPASKSEPDQENKDTHVDGYIQQKNDKIRGITPISSRIDMFYGRI